MNRLQHEADHASSAPDLGCVRFKSTPPLRLEATEQLYICETAKVCDELLPDDTFWTLSIFSFRKPAPPPSSGECMKPALLVHSIGPGIQSGYTWWTQQRFHAFARWKQIQLLTCVFPLKTRRWKIPQIHVSFAVLLYIVVVYLFKDDVSSSSGRLISE
jgi:hypothetical protein